MTTRFIWDLEKAESNRRKHGIGFTLAARAFSDPFALLEQDRIEGGEYRWRAIGMAGGEVLFIAYTTFEEDGDEIIRIISARQATRAERKDYEEERYRSLRN